MIFTTERLRQLCPQASKDIVERVAPALERHSAEFGVTTLMRRAHLIAQLAHESAQFRRLVENLNYSEERIAQVWPRLKHRAHELARHPEALANAAYGSRLGNGDEASGDGWRYRGRGLIQLTGQDNYRERGVELGLDLIGNSGQAAEPEIATRIALSYWASHGCNAIAEIDHVDTIASVLAEFCRDVRDITREIAGSTLGLAERRALTERAKTIFTTPELIA